MASSRSSSPDNTARTAARWFWIRAASALDTGNSSRNAAGGVSV
jgi:hypothetical protein